MTSETLPESDFDYTKGYQEIEHTADCALRIFGRNLEELLLNAARGMNSLMGHSFPESPKTVERHFDLEAFDTESLLVEWLSELVYLAETEMLVFDRFRMEEVSPTHLKAVARGYHAIGLEKCIKAVTYHDLNIIQTDKGLETTVVFDV